MRDSPETRMYAMLIKQELEKKVARARKKYLSDLKHNYIHLYVLIFCYYTICELDPSGPIPLPPKVIALPDYNYDDQ